VRNAVSRTDTRIQRDKTEQKVDGVVYDPVLIARQ